MNGLEQKFGDRIDFIHIDGDLSETREIRQRFGLRTHSHYMLIDANSNIVESWFSYLDEQSMTAMLEEALAALETQSTAAQ